MAIFENTATKQELDLLDNKETEIVRLAGIDIQKFRSFESQGVALGTSVTVFSGRNGSMKTSLMGLIAHPFNSIGHDAFGKPLKTELREVFKFSETYDQERYEYDLILDVARDKHLRANVAIYYVAEKTNRHRIVVSGAEKGDGNFTFNTSFLNMKRLYPLVDTKAKPVDDEETQLSVKEAEALKDFYENVFPSSEYSAFSPILHKNVKTTFAPTGGDAKYDWNAISSGEDNLGAIFGKLVGFQRAYEKNAVRGNGILCIDEFESSLHPVAQIRLFDYLFRWAEKNKVQVVISTHSLHLISYIYNRHSPNLDAKRIIINFISKGGGNNNNYPILENPPYDVAFKELTFSDPAEVAEARKIKVYCEDDIAVHFAKRLIKSQTILAAVDFCSSLDPLSTTPGTSSSALKTVCAQYPALLDRAIVLFDGDVDEAAMKKIKDKKLFLQLPDAEGLAIERRIMVFIHELQNDDGFFVKFGKERARFLDSFKQSGVRSLDIADIKDAQKTSIDICKRWANSNKAQFRKYVTYYASHAQGREQFVQEFLDRINYMNARQGLPKI